MESFYHSLKGELLRKTTFKSFKELRRAFGRYINKFYNAVRLHSGIGYCSPVEYERVVAWNEEVSILSGEDHNRLHCDRFSVTSRL